MTETTSMSVPPLEENTLKQLNREILECPADTLRLILQEVCDNSHEIAHVLHQALCIDPRSKPHTNNSAPADTPAATGLVPGPDSDKENAEDVKGNTHSAKSSKKRKLMESDLPAAKQAKTKNIAKRSVHAKAGYAHCINCYELFDPTALPCHDHDPAKADDPEEWISDTDDDEIDGHDCQYHSGNLELDDTHRVWKDHDASYEDIDCQKARIEVPEGFKWDCCGNEGFTDGCTKERHRSGKKLKYSAELIKAKEQG